MRVDPIEEDERSEHLSHWQRDLVNEHVKCKCVLTSFREPVP